MRTVCGGVGEGKNGSNWPNKSGKGGIFSLWPERVIDVRYFYLTGIHILLSFRGHHVDFPLGIIPPEFSIHMVPEGLMGCPGCRVDLCTYLANEHSLPSKLCNWLRDGHLTEGS